MMPELRWGEEMEEIMELLYRLAVDHKGRLAKSEALDRMGPWVAEAAKRAENLWWLAVTGSPPTMKVTYGGRKALDAALASRDAARAIPHWFGGSIVSVDSETGPVLPPSSFEPYQELRSRAEEQGILTQEDIDRVANSPRHEPQYLEEGQVFNELLFPGTRGFAGTLEFGDDHPLGGRSLDPAGYEGPYEVTVTLTRRGAPDVAFAYVTDAYTMEGDSHLRLPRMRTEDGAEAIPVVMYGTDEGETLHFQLLTNSQGRLGQIRTIMRADGSSDARRKAYRILNPFLCDLSYRYDVPVEILQTNVTEISTYTLSGMKQDDFPEKVLDLEQFFGAAGLNYRHLPLYEFFMRLYREGVSSSSADYGFLCFFRIAEGIVKLRRKRIIEGEDKSPDKVPRSSVFLEGEVVEGDEASSFPAELQNQSLWEAYKELDRQRNKVAHAFLDSEDPLSGHEDIIADRLEGEERAGIRRAQARYLARRMLRSEFWAHDENGSDKALP